MGMALMLAAWHPMPCVRIVHQAGGALRLQLVLALWARALRHHDLMGTFHV